MTMLSPEIEATYEVLQVMGGGMGAVYKVRHRLFDEVRIIKVMQAALAENQALRDRFCAEARRGKHLEHRNIARVLDFQIGSNGNPHLVMEYIDGVTVHDEFARRGGPLDPATVVLIGVQTLAALDYLHSRNLVHRDISPDNLMIARDVDGTPVVKLIDLGISKSLEETAIVTRTGSFMGKITYASPEQSGGVVDARSDFYSLGVVLYELLTAEKPIVGANTAALLIAHHQKPPRPFSETDPKGLVPEPIRRVVLKALEKKADDRYQTATEFAAALQKALTGSRTIPAVLPNATVPKTPTPAPTPRPTPRPAPLPVRVPVPPVPVAAPMPFVPLPQPRRVSGTTWPFVVIAALAVGMIAFAGVATFARLKGSGTAHPVPPIPASASANDSAGSTMAVEAPPSSATAEALPAYEDPAPAVPPVIVEHEAVPEPAVPQPETPPAVGSAAPPNVATTSGVSPAVQSQTQPQSGQMLVASDVPSTLRGVGRNLSEGDHRRQEALAFSNGHQWENAVIAWRQFIRDYSGINSSADHAAWYNLGVAFEELRQWRDAVDAYEHATMAENAQKNDTNNLLRLARCYGKLGRWSDAAVTYQHVLKSDPANDLARRNLVVARQQEARGSPSPAARRP